MLTSGLEKWLRVLTVCSLENRGLESHTHMLAHNLSAGMFEWVPGMHVQAHMHTKYPHALKKKKKKTKAVKSRMRFIHRLE